MADFLIQSDKGSSLDFEREITLELLRSEKHLHSYSMYPLDNGMSGLKKGMIPVGTIDFVTEYVKYAYGVEKENPIEIPTYLRTDEFLKRDYRILTSSELPKQGKYFFKDVSQLKAFGSVLYADYFINDDLFDYKRVSEWDSTLVLDRNHLFQVSSIYDIKAEYRVYVICGEIEAICCYNGDCTVLPDISLIKKAVGLIKVNEKFLRSYTIDVMVGNKGTAIIEIHNFTSVGLYSTIWGSNLLYAYVDGIEYLVNDNHELQVWRG